MGSNLSASLSAVLAGTGGVSDTSKDSPLSVEVMPSTIRKASELLQKPKASVVTEGVKPPPSAFGGVVKKADVKVEGTDFVMQSDLRDSGTEAKGGAKESQDRIGPFTPMQFVGLSAASAALSTIGAVQNIKAQEADAMEMMAQEFNIAKENIEGNRTIRNIAMQSAEVRRLTDLIKGMDRQRGGSLQRQQFITDPRTGTVV